MESKSSGSATNLVDQLVYPGDVVLDLSSMTNQTIKLGGGLRQDCDVISVMKAGRLRFSKPNKYWVESSQKRYVPHAEDSVLGIVVDSRSDIASAKHLAPFHITKSDPYIPYSSTLGL
ncbi:exosome complex component rrp40-like protein [Trifolium pratense]|uniref:Exosome complex component rrp40-like protein n=1 Tax=Trifolium pratense TaxID=57577 RepID=A0A2K3N619_TRIPR|nr:exosome complex component rrp40-like protein [Trifolium pratense]